MRSRSEAVAEKPPVAALPNRTTLARLHPSLSAASASTSTYGRTRGLASISRHCVVPRSPIVADAAVNRSLPSDITTSLGEREPTTMRGMGLGPDAARRKASKAAPRVAVYSHKNPAQIVSYHLVHLSRHHQPARVLAL